MMWDQNKYYIPEEYEREQQRLRQQRQRLNIDQQHNQHHQQLLNEEPMGEQKEHELPINTQQQLSQLQSGILPNKVGNKQNLLEDVFGYKLKNTEKMDYN